jgi:excisionase family DNA binding protein
MELELLTINDVAKQLRISDTAVYRLVRDGRMPHIKAGKRRYLVSRAQLDTFIAHNSVDIDDDDRDVG